MGATVGAQAARARDKLQGEPWPLVELESRLALLLSGDEGWRLGISTADLRTVLPTDERGPMVGFERAARTLLNHMSSSELRDDDLIATCEALDGGLLERAWQVEARPISAEPHTRNTLDALTLRVAIGLPGPRGEPCKALYQLRLRSGRDPELAWLDFLPLLLLDGTAERLEVDTMARSTGQSIASTLTFGSRQELVCVALPFVKQAMKRGVDPWELLFDHSKRFEEKAFDGQQPRLIPKTVFDDIVESDASRQGRLVHFLHGEGVFDPSIVPLAAFSSNLYELIEDQMEEEEWRAICCDPRSCVVLDLGHKPTIDVPDGARAELEVMMELGVSILKSLHPEVRCSFALSTHLLKP